MYMMVVTHKHNRDGKIPTIASPTIHILPNEFMACIYTHITLVRQCRQQNLNSYK